VNQFRLGLVCRSRTKRLVPSHPTTRHTCSKWPSRVPTSILVALMSLQFQPMPLQKRAAPFDDPDYIFELKYDGFRALAIVEHGRAQLLSRNGHPFASFSALAESISDSLPNVRAVIDGEICSLDRRGRPQFNPHFLFEVGVSGLMISPTPVCMRL